MLRIYWIVVGLSSALVLINAKKAIRKFFTDRNAPYLVVYIFFLLVLAYLLIFITSQVIDLVATAQQSDLVSVAQPMPGRLGLRTQVPTIEE